MAPSDRTGCSNSSISSKCLSEFHHRQHDEYDNYGDRNKRDDCNRTLWRRNNILVGYEHHTEWPIRRFVNDVFSYDSWFRLFPRNCRAFSRSHRNRRHHTNDRANIGHKFAVSLLTVSLLVPAGLKAEENTAVDGGITATAAPTAVSTGQATNQAVQINQGGYSEQGYSPGHRCNSSTLTITPFYVGNDVHPDYSRGQNFGIQATISIPLDFEMVRLCKDLAIRKVEKERLDYNLVRVKECAKLLQTGFMFHPKSPFAVICADVVPIAREPKTSAESSQTSSAPES